MINVFLNHVIFLTFVAKKLDEIVEFFNKIVYNMCNKNGVCGKNIRWRLLWKLKEMCT